MVDDGVVEEEEKQARKWSGKVARCPGQLPSGEVLRT